MKSEGIDVCGFGAGEPDFDTPEHIKAAAIAALEAGFTKYTPSSGIPELRQAIADKFLLDNGIDYKPSQIIVSDGAKHSCYNAILATCQPGDEVIIPAPYWLSYPEMVRLAGADPVFVHTKEENGWKLTAEEFENAMTPRTKMIILNSPGNPTGAVYTKEELDAIGKVAAEEEILILSDEIYEKLVYDDSKHFSIAGARAGILRSHHHGQRFQQIVRHDRMASRLSRCARSDRQGDRFHSEPQHLERLFFCAERSPRRAQG